MVGSLGVDFSRVTLHFTVNCLLFQAEPPLLAFLPKLRHHKFMDSLREIVLSFFAIDSIWSVVLRAALWFAVAIVIIVSTDVANPQRSTRNLKSNLGFFLLFIVLSGGLIYLLFGFIAQPAVAPIATPLPG